MCGLGAGLSVRARVMLQRAELRILRTWGLEPTASRYRPTEPSDRAILRDAVRSVQHSIPLALMGEHSTVQRVSWGKNPRLSFANRTTIGQIDSRSTGVGSLARSA